jgi:alanine racemase
MYTKADSKRLYPHPTWIEIDLEQFATNVGLLRDYVQKTLICLPIKANAYGHGLINIGKAAASLGIDYLAVSCLQEGAELRAAGINIPILVLGAIHEDQIPLLIENNLEFTISSKFKAELVSKVCTQLKRNCRIHLEVETGMQRTGVRPDTALALFAYLKSCSYFDIIGIYSHFAASDQLILKKQISLFQNLKNHPIFKNQSLLWHLASSEAVAYFSESHYDMIRPGLILFGHPPVNAPYPLNQMAPFFSLRSKISYFKVVEAGEGISYGHTYITNKKTRIVTIPIGYGDGYRRALSNRGSVLIRGKRFPIVGTICMDQLMVDIGDQEVYVGDEVVLIGKQGDQEISLAEMSSLCDTIPYEILCLLNNRIPRVLT